jgi:hypothetical protein
LARIGQHHARLASAGLDRSKFWRAVYMMAEDESVGEIEIIMIARRYTGLEVNFPSGNDAFKAIRASFRQRSLEAAKIAAGSGTQSASTTRANDAHRPYQLWLFSK